MVQQNTWVRYLWHDRFVNKNQESLVAGVCWFSMTAAKLSAVSVDEEKKSPEKAGNESFGKWSWLTGPSIHRCSAKESSMLSKRIDDATRKQSIYFQKSLNCYVSGGNNTGQKHSKIIVFPFGFSWSFLLLPSCLCGFIWSNTVELGGFWKEVCFSDKSQYPCEDSCESLGHSWQGRCPLAIYPNCRIVLIELFKTIPSQFLLSLDNSWQVFLWFRRYFVG